LIPAAVPNGPPLGPDKRRDDGDENGASKHIGPGNTGMASKKAKKESVSSEMPTPTGDRLEMLRNLFPEAFAEGKLDLAKFRDAVGDIADDRPEKYSFGWSGKRDAIRVLQMPSRATLVPCPNESIGWEKTKNVFIEGDNLEVLKLLYRSYAGRVKLIYIDPPYNIDADVLYPDSFADSLGNYLRITGQTDDDGNLQTSRPEVNGRKHSAWLSLMYPRLFLARQLLKDDGVIFLSIDSTEVSNLTLVMNEIFGEENYIGTLVWKGATDNNPTQIAVEHEYILCYARVKGRCAGVWKNRSPDAKQVMMAKYERIKQVYGDAYELIQREFREFIKVNAETLSPLTHYNQVDERGPFTGSREVHNPKPGGYEYDVVDEATGKTYARPANGYRYPPDTMKRLVSEKRVIFPDDESQIIQLKEYLEDYQAKLASVIHLDSRTGANELAKLFPEGKMFKNPKPTALLRDVFEFVCSENDLVVDFFAGSCSSADAILQLNKADNANRRFIMVQAPQGLPVDSDPHKAGLLTISAIGMERLRRIASQRGRPKQKTLLDDELQEVDYGVRKFRLAPSHNRQWAGVPERNADALTKQMALFVDPLLPGWEPLSVIHEVAMREGYSLSCRVVELPKKSTKPNVVYRVTDSELEQSFLISLDDKIAAGLVKSLGLGKDDLFICRDVALNDQIAANLALQCRLKTI